MVKKRMEITRERIRHLAWLARVELSKKEEASFSDELNEVLAYFRKLREVDVSEVPPTHHVIELTNVFREDEVEPPPSSDLLSIVPRRKERYVRAPRIT